MAERAALFADEPDDAPTPAADLEHIADDLRKHADGLPVMDEYGPLAGEARVLAERVACLAVRVREVGGKR